MDKRTDAQVDLQVQLSCLAGDACHAAAHMYASDDYAATEMYLKGIIERAAKTIALITVERAMKAAA